MHEENRVTARLISKDKQEFDMLYNIYKELLIKSEAVSDTLLKALDKIREEEQNNIIINYELKELVNEAYAKIDKTMLQRFTHPNDRHQV